MSSPSIAAIGVARGSVLAAWTTFGLSDNTPAPGVAAVKIDGSGVPVTLAAAPVALQISIKNEDATNLLYVTANNPGAGDPTVLGKRLSPGESYNIPLDNGTPPLVWLYGHAAGVAAEVTFVLSRGGL